MSAKGFSFTGEVNRPRVEALFKQLSREPPVNRQSPEVIITSKGGYAEPAIEFYRRMGLAQTCFTSVGFREVSSAAVPLYLAGSRRQVTSDMQMYFHPFHAELEAGKYSSPDLRKKLDRVEELELEYARLVAHASGHLTAEAVLDLMHGYQTLSAPELIELNLAH